MLLCSSFSLSNNIFKSFSSGLLKLTKGLNDRNHLYWGGKLKSKFFNLFMLSICRPQISPLPKKKKKIQHFLLSHGVFYSIKDKFHSFSIFSVLSANAFNLDKAKTFSLGKKLNAAQMIEIVYERVEMTEKGENTGYHNFLLYLKCLSWVIRIQGCLRKG